MSWYLVIKFLHVLGATIILGTGTGIAFFMLMAHRTRDAAFIGKTASVVVVADMVFTLTAVIAQPLTGGVLMMLSSIGLADVWLVASLALYVVAGAFWVPVIFMQIEMRDLAQASAVQHRPLPPRYFVLFRRWFLFGIPGFGSVLTILYLMVAKPV